MIASVAGDAWRFGVVLVVAPAVLLFWYVLLSGFGATSAAETSPDPFRCQVANLADPRMRSMHRFIKWATVVCMLALIGECTFILPYVVLRFGWSR